MRSDPPTGDELTRLLVSMKQNVLEQVANEPAPALDKRMPRADRIIGLTLGVVLLLGVGTGAAFAFGVVPFGGEPGAAPVATSTSTPAATPSPTPTPVPPEYVVEPGDPTPEDAEPSGELTAESVYELCTGAVREGLEAEGRSFDPVPFAEAEVVARDDGRFYVWAEFSDSTREPELQNIGAAHCIIGGTVDSPEWIVIGQAHRDYRAQFDPNEPIQLDRS
jgi:hypothetical protein